MPQDQTRPQPGSTAPPTTASDERPRAPAALRPRVPTESMAAIDPRDFGYDQARHLLWRAGFGGTPEQVRLLADWGPEKAVDHLLNFDEVKGYQGPSADDFMSDIMAPPSEEEREMYRRAVQAQDEDTLARLRAERQRREGLDRRQARDMQRWWLRRMIETPRPMEEKLTLFWHGHFATSYRTIENSYHMFLQNQTFRAHAAGNFGDLLFAIIRDPAMLAYLDNNESRSGAPNENLARELMELFSLGVGNYAEGDIKEGARALTGYTFDNNQFVFRPQMHDAGPKRILGKAGNMDGDDFVRAILEQRHCSEFIAAKVYRFFVNEIPAPAHPAHGPTVQAIRTMASTLLSSRYNLKPMLRRLLLSRHFYDPANALANIKSPAELVVGAIRSLRVPARDLGILNDAMDLMGQSLLFPPSVKGWDGGRSWINSSTLFVRQNIMNFLLTGKTPSGFDPLSDIEKYDPTVLLADLAQADPGAEKDPDRIITYLMRFALGGEPSPIHRQTLLDFAAPHGSRVSPELVTGLLALITAMPEYQLC